jgi:hypothetical protein
MHRSSGQERPQGHRSAPLAGSRCPGVLERRIADALLTEDAKQLVVEALGSAAGRHHHLRPCTPPACCAPVIRTPAPG